MKAIKLIKYIFTLSTLAILVGSGFLIYNIPFSKINKLEKGYVKTTVKNGRVEYSIVSSKPSKWLPLSLINKRVYSAIQLSEDWSFYEHFGIDLSQLSNAIVDSAFKGKSLRGASTITQQLVKNLYLTSEKTIYRKLQEAVIAVYIDYKIPKNKILESYLNIIEYGTGVYGIFDASKLYFNKHPFLLDAREGAYLAVLLPNPKLYSTSFQNKKTSLFIESSVRNVLNKMKVAKYINEAELNEEISKSFSWDHSL